VQWGKIRNGTGFEDCGHHQKIQEEGVGNKQTD
jgi:hypothetical protein